MLLKYQYNVSYKRMIHRFVMLFTLLITMTAYGQESNSQKWQIHGFVAQGVIDVDNSNFVNNDGDISTELTEIGINGSYKINDDIRVTGQVVYLDGGNRLVEGGRIDYALIDFGVFNDENWLVNLYLGRFKNNNWLYSSTRDIPHARPTIVLPQSVYFDGFRDIAMGSDGIALKVSHSHQTLGDFDLYLNYGTSNLDTKDVKLLLGDLVQGNGEQEFDAQLGFYWQPDFSQWQFGLSILDSDFIYKPVEFDLFVDASFSFQQYTGNALFEGDKWEFSAEFFQQDFRQDGLYYQQYVNEASGQGMYFQSRYKFNNQLTFLAKYERFYNNKDDKNGSELEKNTFGRIPHYFGYQNDITLSGTYDFNASIRVQLEHHWIKGTARLTPFIMPNTTINNKEYWNFWAVQLMYWF